MIPATGPIDTTALKTAAAAPSPAEAELRRSAREFEAAFVQQMLQYAGFAEAFGSNEGVATDAFSSYVLQHIAEEIASRGDFGLAEKFYAQLASVARPTADLSIDADAADRGARV